MDSPTQKRRRQDVKVLMVEHFFPESSYTLELGRELGKYTDLTVFCRQSSVPETPGIHWVNRFYSGGKGKAAGLLLYLKGLLALRSELRRGYDVVHVQSFKEARWEIPLYLKNRNSFGFLVHTVHNLLPHEASASDRQLYTRFYQQCDLLLVHNEWCRQELCRSFSLPDSKILVLPHGAYNLVGKAPEKREEDGKTHFLQFGLIRRYKGLDILLQALALVPPEERERLRVTVAGHQFTRLDGTDYQALARQLGVEKCVEFRLGYIRDDELPGLFGQADLCLFPYREIYGSGALLMAYTYGRPVIASDIPVFREETEEGKTGLLFASEDAPDLARKLRQAMSWTEAERAERRRCIEELVRNKYSWARSARGLFDAYRALTEGRGRAAESGVKA